MEVKVGYTVAFNHQADATWFEVVAVEGFTLTVREADVATVYASQTIDRSAVKRIRFPITDKANPAPKLNTMEAFNVRWQTTRGRKNGNGCSKADAAQAMANRVASAGATDVTIERHWIAGYV